MNENSNFWRKMDIIKCGDAEFGWFPSIPMALMGTIFGDESLKVGDILSHLSFEVGDGSAIFPRLL